MAINTQSFKQYLFLGLLGILALTTVGVHGGGIHRVKQSRWDFASAGRNEKLYLYMTFDNPLPSNSVIRFSYPENFKHVIGYLRVFQLNGYLFPNDGVYEGDYMCSWQYDLDNPLTSHCIIDQALLADVAYGLELRPDWPG